MNIYRVQHSLFDSTLPRIILRILNSGNKIHLVCRNTDEMKHIDNLLWTFSKLSFIPHVTEEDNFLSELQDVIITSKLKNADVQYINRSLVFICHEMVKNTLIQGYQSIFLIATQNMSVEKLKKYVECVINSKKAVKIFTQTINNTWEES